MAAVLLAVLVQLAPAAQPREALARYGLREENGRWVLAEERRLARLLGRIDSQLRELHSTGQAWRKQVQRVEVVQKDLKALQEQYDEVHRLSGRTGNLVAQQLQQQLGNLSIRLGELRLALQKLQAEGSPLHGAASEHAKARGDVSVAAAAILDAHRRLADGYERLDGLADLDATLAELRESTGMDVRLGSAEAFEAQVRSATERIAKALRGGELPLVLRGELPLLPTIIAGQPATFLLDVDHPHTLVPQRQVERLNLVVPAIGDSQWQRLEYGDRELLVLPQKLESLQVGDVVLNDIAIFVTHPDHAELGLRLGSDIADRLHAAIDRGLWQITVGPK